MDFDPRSEFQRHVRRIREDRVAPNATAQEMERVRCRILARYAGDLVVTTLELEALVQDEHPLVREIAQQILDERCGRTSPAVVHSGDGAARVTVRRIRSTR